MENQLRLSVLNQMIRDALLDAFPASLWIIAEISEIKINRTGHCYLELIEQEGDEIIARARATIWSYTFRMLKPYFETTTGQPLTQGIKILVNATVEFHPNYGLSLNIKDIDPAYTLGDKARQRNEIIKRLQREGVFDMNKELPLPLVPQRIAIISSSTAAGYQDFMDQLLNNSGGFRFDTRLFEATMQGDGAAPSIMAAFDRIFDEEDQFDLVVIIRGGGAVADLNCFDNYDLALSVTQFPLPVVTGIGHEKDDTIVDLVAHTRLKTPTAVAEFLVQGVERFLDLLAEKVKSVIQLASEIIDNREMEWVKLMNQFNRSGSSFLSRKSDQVRQNVMRFQKCTSQFTFKSSLDLNRLKHRASLQTGIFVQNNKTSTESNMRRLKFLIAGVATRENGKLALMAEGIKKITFRFTEREKGRLKSLNKTLELLRPESILNRGYTLTLKEGKIIKEAKNLHPGDLVETRFPDGSVLSEITKKIGP